MTRAIRLTALSLLLVVPPALAEEPVESELDGMYVSKGQNPDGTEYRGIVQIARHGDTFLVSWMFPQASEEAIVLVPTSVGIGVVSGGMLAVSYYGQRMAGVIIYRIEEGGVRLTGRWVAAGDSGTVQSELLTKLPRVLGVPAPEPEHAPEEKQPQPQAKPRELPRVGGIVL